MLKKTADLVKEGTPNDDNVNAGDGDIEKKKEDKNVFRVHTS